MAKRKNTRPAHPGELLQEKLAGIGVSMNELARALRVPMNRISAIVNGKRSISADTATRLARYFGTSPESWLDLQNAHLLGMIDRLVVEREVLPRGTPPGTRAGRPGRTRDAR